MALVKTINTVGELQQEFASYNRDYYSYEAYEQIFDWYEEGYDENGNDIELDVIAICCAFNEYSKYEFVEQYEDLYPFKEYINDEMAYDDYDLFNGLQDYIDGYVERLCEYVNEKVTQVTELSNGNILVIE